MPKISGLVRSFLIERLLDTNPSTKGFNYWIDQLAGGADYPDVTAFQMVNGANLLEMAIDERTLDSTSIDAEYPIILISSIGLEPRTAENAITPSEFSGPVTTKIDFITSFEVSELPTNPEEWHDLFEDAIFETFTRYDTAGLWVTGDGFSFNNQIRLTRYPLTTGGDNWRQRTRATIEVQLGDAQPR